MAFGPLFLLQANGQVDVKFEDFEDLRDHPSMVAFMADLSQFLEGLFEADLKEVLTERIDMDAEIPDNFKDSDSLKQTLAQAKLCHTAFDIFDMIGTEETSVEVRASWDKAATVDMKIKSADLGKGFTLALALSFYRANVMPFYKWMTES